MPIGDRIRKARKYKELNQTELAEKLRVTQSMIGQHERGNRNPKRDTLQKIANALNLSLNIIVGNYYFYDDNRYEIDEAEEKRCLFNDEQKNSAITEAGYSPSQFGEFWMEETVDYSDDRVSNINTIRSNVNKLNDKGVKELAKHSDQLVGSEEYKRDRTTM